MFIMKIMKPYSRVRHVSNIALPGYRWTLAAQFSYMFIPDMSHQSMGFIFVYCM